MQCQVAQVNIARARAPLDHPLMAGFAARLDAVNALAESSPGFIWRLKTDVRDAPSISPYGDELIVVNLSVWESIEHLKQFVYRSVHAEAMKSRRQWFERLRESHMALWWIAPGHEPTVAEAKERLAYLRLYGETEFAFSFAKVIYPPSAVRAIGQPDQEEQPEEPEQPEQPEQSRQTAVISGSAA